MDSAGRWLEGRPDRALGFTHDESTAQEVSFIYGPMADDVTAVVLRTDEGDRHAEMFQGPPGFDVDFYLLVVDAPASEARLVAYGDGSKLLDEVLVTCGPDCESASP